MGELTTEIEVDPDSVCYCGWTGLNDSGCLCVHPELIGVEY